MVRRVLYASGLLLMVGAVGVVTSASTPIQVPEVSGSTLTTGLAALAGGLLIVRARWGR